MMGLREKLEQLRREAGAELRDAAKAEDNAAAAAWKCRGQLVDAVVAALEAGLKVEVVAAIIGLSTGTVQAWARDPETAKGKEPTRRTLPSAESDDEGIPEPELAPMKEASK